MKKIFFIAVAMVAAMSMNAQGVWQATTAESKAQVNHKEKDPDTGKDVTIIDENGDVVAKAGEATVIETGIEHFTLTLVDGAKDWEVMSNGVGEDATVATFVGQDNVTYNKGYIQGGTNGMEGHLLHANGTSAHIEFAVEAEGIVYVAAKFGKNKSIYAAEVPNSVIADEELSLNDMTPYLLNTYSEAANNDGTVAATTKKYPLEDGTGVGTTEASADVYAALPVPVKPGNTYFFWVAGSKIMLSGINYVKTGETPVENVAAAVKATKVIENGQVIILKNNVRYNVLGAEMK